MFRKIARFSVFFLLAQIASATGSGMSNANSWVELRDLLEMIETGIDWSIEGSDLVVDIEQQTVLARAWEKLDTAPDGLADEELEALFEVVWMIGHRVPLIGDLGETGIDHQQIMKSVFAELQRRGSIEERHVLSLQRMAIAYRQFEEARTIVEAFPNAALESIPPIRSPHTEADQHPRVWQYDPSAGALISQSVDVHQLDWIIQISPGCGFARAAMRAFTSDPQLGAIMSNRLLWLVPPNWKLDLNEQRRWNAAHPESPMVLMHDAEEWSFLTDLPVSPQFIRLRNGQPIQTIVGWPTDNSHKALLLASAAQHDY